MRLEAFITSLQELKDVHGDLEVTVTDNDGAVWEVQGVEFSDEVSSGPEDNGIYERLILIET